MYKSSVFKSEVGDNHSLSDRAFYTSLALFIVLGLFVTAVATTFSAGVSITGTHILVLGLVVPIIGIVIASFSKNWLISLAGYMLVCGPFGYILGPQLSTYSPDLLFQVAAMTGFVTAVFGAAGIIYPNVFKNLGGPLLIVLCSLLAARVIGIFVPAIGNLGILDWIGAALFSMYIGYDMYRASKISRTLDNAVDCALALYLDIINLFLSLLGIADD